MASEALQLYRSIRRLHRRLPAALKFMGDQYLRDEFARHRTAAPEYIPGFIKGWTAYRDTLAQQLDEASERVKGEAIPVGAKLEPGELDSLSPQQLGQLYALKQAAKSNKDGDA